jgi:4'-phosphopantetheinyl transferase
MELFADSNPTLLPINPGEAHIWFAFPMEINAPDILESYHRIMTRDEKKRQKRYYFKEDRHTCLITRALVRSVLSRYVKKEPGEWRFLKNKYGKPRIKPNSCALPLQFNLSHTEGLVACIVTLDNHIGIDVENLKHRNVSLKVADRFFSSLEVESLNSLKKALRRKRFLTYWTLKESYIKARGMGLSIPLDKFSFVFSEIRPISIQFDPAIKDDAGNWQFFRLNPTTMHTAAVSIRKNHLPKFQITIRTTTPLVNEQSFPCELLE